MLKKFRPLETDDKRKDIVIQSPASSGILMERFGELDRQKLYIGDEPLTTKDVKILDPLWLENTSIYNNGQHGVLSDYVWKDGLIKTTYVSLGSSSDAPYGADHKIYRRTWDPVTDAVTETETIRPIGDWKKTWSHKPSPKPLTREPRWYSTISSADLDRLLLIDLETNDFHILPFGFSTNAWASSTKFYYSDAGLIIYVPGSNTRKYVDYAAKTVNDIPAIHYQTSGNVIQASHVRLYTNLAGELRLTSIVDDNKYNMDGTFDPITTAESAVYTGGIDENNNHLTYEEGVYLVDDNAKDIRVSYLAGPFLGKFQGKLFHIVSAKMVLSDDDAFYIDVTKDEKFVIPPGKMLYYVPTNPGYKDLIFPSFIATTEI